MKKQFLKIKQMEAKHTHTIELDEETTTLLESLGQTWGIRDKGEVIRRLLKELLEDIPLGN